ncbi:MAG TPA: DUF6584 family protein [Gaiellaceae bacterium]|nr:DUF6584 family protein [Gaiellaceae bacterium]
MRAVERARADVAAGRLWKARDRLEGALANAPADQEVLVLLGEVHHAMGDVPAAGRHWFLTERSDAQAEEAIAAMRERHPTPSALFAALPVKAPLEAYPPAVRERLEEILRDDDVRWAAPRKAATARRPAGGGGGLGWVGAAAVTALVLPWLLGVVALAYLLWRLLAWLV